MDINNYKKEIFCIKNEPEFNDYAIELFQYQYKNNETYNQYIQLLNYQPKNIIKYYDIPFLPIELFRNHHISSNQNQHEAIFLSSGTTSNTNSQHYIYDLELYKKSVLASFSLFFGNPQDFIFLCLVPNYNTHINSSLSFMCMELIQKSNNEKSDFYINKYDDLKKVIIDCQKKNLKFILFGLSFEILHFAENYNIDLTGSIIIETGGTKKQNERLTKDEIYLRIKKATNVKNIFSEYGMAELLSQSYCTSNYFQSPPWKKILIRDKTNPLKIKEKGERGCIDIIDLANKDSCGFIATNDTGYLTKFGFNITGRAQSAAARGCNLMI